MHRIIRSAIVVTLPLLSWSYAQADPVSGRVEGPDGQAVGGVKIVVSRYSRQKNEMEYSVFESDATGKFATDLPLEEGLKIFSNTTAYKAGFAPWSGGLKPSGNVLKLEVGRVLQGVVQDRDGKPVVGATISLHSWRLERADAGPFSTRSMSWSLPEMLRDAYEVKSGADGRWSMNDVPAGYSIYLTIKAAGFATTEHQVVLEELKGDAPAVVLPPGAVATGRVEYEDGKPAAGILVRGSGAMMETPSSAQAKSESDGSFRLEGLGEGVHILTVHDSSGEWVLLHSEKMTTQAGKEVAAPKLVLTRGAVIEGRVTDAKTGAPLAGRRIDNSAGGSRGGSTGADGRYRLRVPPGKQNLYVSGRQDGYLDPEQGSYSNPIVVTLQIGDTKTVDFSLVKGLTVQGSALDEAGQPVANVPVSLQTRDRNSPLADYYSAPSTITNEKGEWTIVGLVPGQFDLTINGDWEVQGAKQVVLPQTAPLRVVLKKQIPLQAAGRIVTLTGEPIEGASVAAMVLIPSGPNSFSGANQKLKSGVDGKFVVDKLKPDYRLEVQASKVGFRYVRGGAVKNADGVFTIADIVMQPLNGRITGIITDAAGRPLANVTVSAPDGGGTRTTTNADGRFTLEGLTEGEVTIVAANATGAVSARRKTGTAEYKLALQPPITANVIDKDAARKILLDVWETSRGNTWHGRREMPLLLSNGNPDGALGWIAKNDAKGAEWMLNQVVEKLIEKDPLRHAEWIAAHLSELQGSNQQTYHGVKLAVAITKEKPELAAVIYDRLLKIKEPEDQFTRFRPFQLAALAARLGRKDEAEKWFRQGLATIPAEQGPETQPAMREGRNSQLFNAAETLARGSAWLAEWAADEIDAKFPDDRVMALRMAIGELVAYDLPAAQHLLEKIKTTGGNQADFGYSDSAVKIIDALGPQDPQAALALARRVDYVWGKPEALLHAAAFQPRESSLELLQEAANAVPSHYYTSTRLLSRIGAAAYRLDPATGQAILDRARTNLIKRIKEPGNDTYWRPQSGANEVAHFAMAYAPIDPVESRFLLEEEFAYQNREVPEDRRYGNSIDLVIAMASLDPQRAQEMARQVTGGNLSNQFSAELKLAQFLVTEPEKRMGLLSQW